MADLTKAWDWDRNTDEIWFTPSEDSYFLLNRWKDKGFNRFLDLGCGRGRHSIQFAKRGFDVNSVDLSNIAVDGLNEWAVKENLSINAVIADMMNLPFEDNTFDCLLAYHVISHTDTKGIIKVISEIKRVLKPGGEFYITFCSKNAWSYKDAGFPKLDENTVVKIEDGAENNVPHFFVDAGDIKELLKELKLITVRQVQDVVLAGHDYVSWHYFVKVESDMNEKTNELRDINTKFAESGWDLIDAPAKSWLSGDKCKDELIMSIERADMECGSCGCEFDPLYKRFVEMKDLL